MNKLLTISLLLITQFTFAQIEMNSSGNVAIGGGTPSATYDLTTSKLIAIGEVKFSAPTCSILFDWFYPGSPYYPAFRMMPTVNNVSQIGDYTHGFKQIWSYAFISGSDRRHKENVRPLTNSLDKIIALNGLKYDLKREIHYDQSNENIGDSEYDSFIDKDRKDKIGFMAQDVFEVIPEVVVHDDSLDVYGIDYVKIIPFLVEAMKEQQEQISYLEGQLTKLNEKDKSSSSLRTAEVENAPNDADTPRGVNLLQNAPNPFSDQTEIAFTINEDAQEATLFIYDLQGTQLKSYPINQRGGGSVTINGGELKAGMYLYSLLVDGDIIGTEKMILTK